MASQTGPQIAQNAARYPVTCKWTKKDALANQRVEVCKGGKALVGTLPMKPLNTLTVTHVRASRDWKVKHKGVPFLRETRFKHLINKEY